MSRLGIVFSTATRAPVGELVALAQRAEEHGFEAVLINEGRSDALAYAEAIALQTSRIRVGTNIANIYLRHPLLTAMTASVIAELSQGRLLLGLGISHRPVIESLGLEMERPGRYLREYLQTVKKGLSGEATGAFLQPHSSGYPVPIYVAALRVESAALGGELAHGIMPFLAARSHLPKLVGACRDAAARSGGDPDARECIVSIPTFVSADLEQARSAARYNLAFYAQMPFYAGLWERCGFAGGGRRPAAGVEPEGFGEPRQRWSPSAWSRRSACSDRPSAAASSSTRSGAAGVTLPVLAVSPVNQERLAATHEALSRLAPDAGG